ncbi:ComEC/Rec2 family competence protein [Streptomyces sp. NPDC056948]|uniref:ComEC/Rec2 family competence protein n=1 Tax=Streptomyces sp. NPDC056948 TaxID=3345975 RepID=UPI0036351600
MYTFDFLDAKHGDCFLVRWGTSDERVMLVDGGPGGVYRASLRGRLQQLGTPGGDAPPHLDVVCLSHVDDDHADGLVRLFRDMRQAQQDGDALPYAVDALWFNSVEELVDKRAPGLSASVKPLLERAATDAAVAASYQQGRDIRNAAGALHLDGNAPFGGPLTEGAEATLGDLDVTVVAPDEAALEELEERWRKAKQRGDPDVITAAYSDSSVPNLSSIVLLLRHEDRTALLTGDARGDHILTGLRDLGLLDDSEPLHVDLLKLPHHGSDRNVEAGFFEQVRADHYVVSADGIRHHHPNEDTLRWLVESRAPDDEYVIHLTNHIPFAEEELTRLSEGRAFDVDVREPAEQALVVTIGDRP